MKRKGYIIIAAIFSMIMCGCSSQTSEEQNGTVQVTSAQTEAEETETETQISEEIVEAKVTDKVVCEWLYNSLTDPEEFTDYNNYRYYARTLGLDKDYFLNPNMWEVYYNDDININNEINGKEIYLMRLNPYLLLDIYAKRNDCTVDEICSSLSATKEQLYYNWGYDTSWIDYEKNHSRLKVFASEKELSIFGRFNGENRCAVMRTHTLTVDTNDNNICTYESNVGSSLSLRRMDLLGAVSEDFQTYSEYTEQEKTAAFTVNGIGIRTVIPLSLPNSWVEIPEQDIEITPFVNVSPYAYGCTDDDKIEIIDYSQINNGEE